MRTIAGLLLTTLLTMTAGCAQTDWIDRTLVTVDVTGMWEGSVAGSWMLELEQQGSTVTGSYDTEGLLRAVGTRRGL